jgi:hypothetical protein
MNSGERATDKAARPDPLAGFPLRGAVVAWQRFMRFLNRHGADRRVRVAIAMAAIASFGAVTAYRASEEELKGSSCERRIGEARTYELVQRQTYLDKLTQHERWSDRYAVSVGYAQRLLRQADAIREGGQRGRDPNPATMDAEAQIEFADARTLAPVRDFTDPLLRPGPSLERQLRARAQQDVIALGLPNRCLPRDIVPAAAPPATIVEAGNDYLQPLQDQVDAIHAKSLQDSRSVVMFVFVLVCFTLSEAFAGRTRAVWEITGSILFPVALLVAMRQNDDSIPGLFLVTFLVLAGLSPLIWAGISLFGIGEKRRGADPIDVRIGRRRQYRVAKGVLFVVSMCWIALVVSVPLAIANGTSYQWPLWFFSGLLITGIGWLAWLATLLESAVPRPAVRSESTFRRLQWPIASLLTAGAFFVALPFAIWTLAARQYVPFATYAAMIAGTLYIVFQAMRTSVTELRLGEPHIVEERKLLAWLDRIRLFVVGLGIMFVAFSLDFIVFSWQNVTQYRTLALLMMLLIIIFALLLWELTGQCRPTVVEMAKKHFTEAEKDKTEKRSVGLAVALRCLLAVLLLDLVITVLAMYFGNRFPVLPYFSYAFAVLFAIVLFVYWWYSENWAAPARVWAGAGRAAEEPPQYAGAAPQGAEPVVGETADSVALGRGLLAHIVESRFDAAVVGAIAITALFSAFAGFGYSNEHNQANVASDRATEVQLRLLRSSTRETARAYQVIDTMTAYREARLRDVAAAELVRSPTTGRMRSDARPMWDHEFLHWSTTAATLNELSTADSPDGFGAIPGAVALNGSNGPYQDPSFPANLFSHATVEVTAHELALWDAYDEQSTQTERRATTLLGSIALFAIALYLLGQALHMGRKSRGGYFLASFGILLTGAGLMYGIGVVPAIRSIDAIVAVPDECSTAQERVTTTRAEAAAQCYSRAELLRALARSQPDLKAAHAAYVAATSPDLRPEFALALYRAVQITPQAVSPQLHIAHVSVIDRDQIPSLIEEDDRVKRDLEQRDRIVPPSLLDSEGFHRYLLALTKPGVGFSDSLGLLKSDTLRDAHDPSALFHRGLVALAARDFDQADDAYGQALATPSQDPDLSEAAISDLEVLGAGCALAVASCTELQKPIADLEGLIVEQTWFPLTSDFVDVPSDSRPALRIEVSPGGVAWRLDGPGAAAIARTAPVMLVFHYDDMWHSWYAMPDVSGPIAAADIEVQSDSSVRGFRSVLARPTNAGCLDAHGRYRVALYVRNHVVAEQTYVSDEPMNAFDGVSLREQGVALCYPSGSGGWRREAPSNETLSVGYRSPDGARGLRAFAFFGPRMRAPERGRNEYEQMVRAIDVTSYRLRSHSLSLNRFQERPVPCRNLSVPGGTARAFISNRLTLLARAWTSPDGLVFVGVVWHDMNAGSETPVVDTLSCNTLASMIPIESPSPPN